MISQHTTWRNVRLIWVREMRDQMRDRRTLFMIFVLPILLYPLMGMSFFQVAQFVREAPSPVKVFGGDRLTSDANLPALFHDGALDASLFDSPDDAKLIELSPADPPSDDMDAVRDEASQLVASGVADAALIIPPDLENQLARLRRQIAAHEQAAGEARYGEDRSPDDSESAAVEEIEIHGPEIVYTTAREQSELAKNRLADALARWRSRVGGANVEAGGVPHWVVRPFEIDTCDAVDDTQFRGAALWSKVLPVLLIVWALSGAFYPAIDLCAGEKERGTLETLLCSPAARSEIVLGKLLTVMVFSMVTSLLNVLSGVVVGTLLVSNMAQFGAPPLTAVLWLLVALPPVAALFGAMSLTLAAFARSTKEGQYYLMPLLLLTLTLVILPMAPGVQLTLGQSLIPISGLVLLLRSVLEGDFGLALRFAPAVAVVTLGCCYLAIRTATDLFNSEAVLFSSGERFDLKLWVRRLLLDRRETPSFAMAICCGLVILLIKFFMELSSHVPTTATDLAKMLLIQQLVVIAMPAVLFTIMLTTRWGRTLRVGLPRPAAIPLAVLLAVLLRPAMQWLQAGVMTLYPIPDKTMEILQGLEQVTDTAPLWLLLLVMALLPALCEEFAFRGFILSGLRQAGYKWRAIVISALFFGFTHGFLQQQLLASLTGAIIAYLVVQSGSLWAGVAFHVTHNGMSLALARWAKTLEAAGEGQAVSPWLGGLLGISESPLWYDVTVTVVCSLLAFGLLWVFHRMSDQPR